MSQFVFIRLGRDSVEDIKRLDAIHSSPQEPITFVVRCAQVSSSLVAGAYAFICFGSDNSGGQPTPWVQGLRALGKVTAKTGGPGYNDQWQVAVEIRVVLPESATKMDLLAKAPTAYFWCAKLPVLGLTPQSQQTTQLVKDDDPNQNIAALAYGLNLIAPSFRQDTVSAYPELSTLFEYIPLSPQGTESERNGLPDGSESETLEQLVERFQVDAERSMLRVGAQEVRRFLASLLSKRFLIATGLAGSGKTKLAQAISRWLPPALSTKDPFTPGAKFVSDRVEYVVRRADSIAVEFWNEAGEDGPSKKMVPREVIAEWADYIQHNGLSEDTSAQVISDAVERGSQFSNYLHRFRPFLKQAAFALLEARNHKIPLKCYEVVPVGADWMGNENILGYPNGLDSSSYITKPALDLFLQAKEHPELPHFLILDEMNLSHVERYFADILSAVESEEAIPLHADERRANGKSIPQRTLLPDNLFIIGTVNVDETTYMFSPKVLDRANVIEFSMRAEDLASFFTAPSKPDLAMLEGQGAFYGKAFVRAARGSAEVPSEVGDAFSKEMVLFFKAMQEHGAEFGYRMAHEASRFIYFYKLLGQPGGQDAWLPEAFDCIVVQKMLPKLHGSRIKLGPLLKKLWFLCALEPAARGEEPLKAAEEAAKSSDKAYEPSEQVPEGALYPLSARKIGRMWRLLNENGFTSFTEA